MWVTLFFCGDVIFMRMSLKEIQQWKWQKNEKTGEYLDEPVPFQDDAMAMLRYSIEQERRTKPKLNRGVTGGI
jgi:phage terminase large subunit